MVTVSQKEFQRVKVIENAVAGRLRVSEAARLLQLSERQVQRLKRRFCPDSVAWGHHGKRGRPLPWGLPAALRRTILQLARGKYQGFNDSHLCQKLHSEEHLSVSRESVRRILRRAQLTSPQKRRPRQYRARRLRRPRFGMMVLTDASRHDWLEGRGPELTLIGFQDDATSQILSAHFQLEAKTPLGYFRALPAMVTTHGVQVAEIAEGVFGFELEMGGEDLAGGVILKADESEFGATTFQPVLTAGVGEHHHAQAGTAQAAGAVLAGATLLRRSQLGAAQDAAHALAADRQMLFAVQFLAEMRIVEALILAARQLQDGAAQGRRQSPGHGPSPIAVMHPSHGVGAKAPLEPLHLPFTQLQQSSRFAYAQPTGHRILNHFHALELFLTHCHHPPRVTKSGCS